MTISRLALAILLSAMTSGQLFSQVCNGFSSREDQASFDAALGVSTSGDGAFSVTTALAADEGLGLSGFLLFGGGTMDGGVSASFVANEHFCPEIALTSQQFLFNLRTGFGVSSGDYEFVVVFAPGLGRDDEGDSIVSGAAALIGHKGDGYAGLRARASSGSYDLVEAFVGRRWEF